MATHQPHTSSIDRLIEGLRDAAFVVEADTGRTVLWNRAAESLFGYSAGEELNHPIIGLIPERARSRFWAALSRCWTTDEAGASGEALPLVELPVLRSSGDEFVAEMTLSPLDCGVGDRRLVLAIARSVAEYKRLVSSQ